VSPEEVEPFLGLWPAAAGRTVTLINVSENHTFRLDRAGEPPVVLRVHRPGYQSANTILSELEWLSALRRDTGMPVPQALPGGDGRLVQSVGGAEGERNAVLFAHVPGREPLPMDDLGDLFETLGGLAATAHRQASAFRPSPGFERQVWTAAAILDGRGPWGDWRLAPGAAGPHAAPLERLARHLHDELDRYGSTPERFGLIHADMRLANLLVDGDHVTLIDFDDCGFCWFMYDFAAATSFFEDSPAIPELRRRWLAGYTRVRPLAPADVDILDAMVLLRRLALLAFIGSHPETALAATHAGDFARVTLELAQPYLARFG